MDLAFTRETILSPDYYEEYVKYLVEIQQFEKAWNLYSSAREEVKKNGNVKLRVLGAAIECGEMAFAKEMFAIEQANIREGEAVLNEYWIRMQELLLIQDGIVASDAKVQAEQLELPYIVDFRLN
ncbi:MAG: hypothetical protein R3Y54_12390 [Eubacteriales bacterium]